jgi:hypothetical protein
MAEITPSGIIVTGAPTNVRASAQPPGTRDVLENMYNDFLDSKQQGKIKLEVSFDTWIRNSVEMLEQHRRQELFEQFSMGQIGKAEYEALEEYRSKLVVMLKKSDASLWGFDQYGIQYIESDQRHLFKERVGRNDMVVPDHRPVHIKTGNGSGIVG